MKICSLFSGGLGGLELPFRELGHDVVFASEWDKYAAHQYTLNYNQVPHGDITKIEASDIPVHDILTGGFSCQPFSVSGKKLGFEDIRGKVIFDVERVVAHRKPKVVFLENVKGLTFHNKGETFQIIIKLFKDLGYTIYHKILDAKDFGVPQSRQRVFIVGIRGDHKPFDFPVPPCIPTKLSDILEKDVDEKYYMSQKAIDGMNKRLVNNRNKKVGFGNTVFSPDCPSTHTLTAKYGHGQQAGLIGDKPMGKCKMVGYLNKGSQGDRIYDSNGLSVCLSANGGGGGAKTGLYMIEGKVRKLTPRECLRLQGIGEDYKIEVSDAQMYKIAGNGVCVAVVRAIVGQIMKAIG